MKELGLTDATLLSPEPPCKVCDVSQGWDPHTGDWGAEAAKQPGMAAINTVLPPGSKLTIVDPGATGVYHSAQLGPLESPPPVGGPVGKTPPPTITGPQRGPVGIGGTEPAVATGAPKSTATKTALPTEAPKRTAATAKELARELAATAHSTKRWATTVKLASWGLSAWNIYDLLGQIAKARNLAYATFAHGGNPFRELIEETQSIAMKAKEIQDFFYTLDLRTSIPRKDDLGWAGLQDAQNEFLFIEANLYAALKDVESAIGSLKLQRTQLAAAVEDKQDALALALLTPTSLAGVEAYDLYMFSGAAVQADRHILAAIAAYGYAKNSISFDQKMAQAAVRQIEVLLRQTEMIDPGGMFKSIATEDLFKTPSSRFTWR